MHQNPMLLNQRERRRAIDQEDQPRVNDSAPVQTQSSDSKPEIKI